MLFMHKDCEKWIKLAVYTGERPKDNEKDYVLITEKEINDVKKRVHTLLDYLSVDTTCWNDLYKKLDVWVQSTEYDKQQANIYKMMSKDGIAERAKLKVQANWRYYNNYIDLVLALYGDYCSEKQTLGKETVLAGCILDTKTCDKIKGLIRSLVVKINGKVKELLPDDKDKNETLSKGQYFPLHKVTTWNEWEKGYLEMEPGKIVACLHDISKPLQKKLNWTEATMNKSGFKITKDNMRMNVSTPEEDFDWTSRARWADAPIWAGPSYTAHGMFYVADKTGASKDEIQAYAYCIFAFWNKEYPLTATPIHRMYGVMTAAREFDVLPDVCDPKNMYNQAYSFIRG
ncbi:MAG: hypothetical protein KKC76_01615 [Proteobacteria bacterium]|nr:hypothetical protein [Pseudomonadota bacterium]MBU4294371.1 hypothetical protein [Pseudomonadota bacterium]MCG2749158.1 hypothetical protein [Desulfobulbaceae bacterium]